LHLTEEREKKFGFTASNRQWNASVVLENVHDSHNIGAVLRSCDAVGIRSVYIINTDPRLRTNDRYYGATTSTGAIKWMDMHFYEEIEPAVKAIRENHELILSTHMNSESKSLYDLDLNASCALVFGNEHLGISDELLAHADANFLIPQKGMVQSLNISVACAVTLFELMRQREKADLYSKGFDEKNPRHALELDRMKKIHLEGKKPVPRWTD